MREVGTRSVFGRVAASLARGRWGLGRGEGGLRDGVFRRQGTAAATRLPPVRGSPSFTSSNLTPFGPDPFPRPFHKPNSGAAQASACAAGLNRSDSACRTDNAPPVQQTVDHRSSSRRVAHQSCPEPTPAHDARESCTPINAYPVTAPPNGASVCLRVLRPAVYPHRLTGSRSP